MHRSSALGLGRPSSSRGRADHATRPRNTSAPDSQSSGRSSTPHRTFSEAVRAAGLRREPSPSPGDTSSSSTQYITAPTSPVVPLSRSRTSIFVPPSRTPSVTLTPTARPRTAVEQALRQSIRQALEAPASPLLLESVSDREFRAELVEDGVGGAVSRKVSAPSFGLSRSDFVMSSSHSRVASSFRKQDSDSTILPDTSYEAFEAGLMPQQGMAGSVGTPTRSARKSVESRKPVVSVKGSTASPTNAETPPPPSVEQSTKNPSPDDSDILASFPLQDPDKSFAVDRDTSFEVEEPSFYASEDTSFHITSGDLSFDGVELFGGVMEDLEVIDESETSDDGESGSEEVTDDEDKENRKVARSILTPSVNTSAFIPVEYNEEAERSLRAPQTPFPIVDDRSSRSILGDLSSSFGRLTVESPVRNPVDPGFEDYRPRWDLIAPDASEYRSPKRRPSLDSSALSEESSNLAADLSEEILYRPSQGVEDTLLLGTPTPAPQGSAPGVIGSEVRNSLTRSGPSVRPEEPSLSSLALASPVESPTPSRASAYPSDNVLTGSTTSAALTQIVTTMPTSISDPIQLSHIPSLGLAIVPSGSSLLFGTIENMAQADVSEDDESTPEWATQLLDTSDPQNLPEFDLQQPLPEEPPMRVETSVTLALDVPEVVEPQTPGMGRLLSQRPTQRRTIRRVSQEPPPMLHDISEVSSTFSGGNSPVIEQSYQLENPLPRNLQLVGSPIIEYSSSLPTFPLTKGFSTIWSLTEEEKNRIKSPPKYHALPLYIPSPSSENPGVVPWLDGSIKYSPEADAWQVISNLTGKNSLESTRGAVVPPGKQKVPSRIPVLSPKALKTPQLSVGPPVSPTDPSKPPSGPSSMPSQPILPPGLTPRYPSAPLSKKHEGGIPAASSHTFPAATNPATSGNPGSLAQPTAFLPQAYAPRRFSPFGGQPMNQNRGGGVGLFPSGSAALAPRHRGGPPPPGLQPNTMTPAINGTYYGFPPYQPWSAGPHQNPSMTTRFQPIPVYQSRPHNPFQRTTPYQPHAPLAITAPRPPSVSTPHSASSPIPPRWQG